MANNVDSKSLSNQVTPNIYVGKIVLKNGTSTSTTKSNLYAPTRGYQIRSSSGAICNLELSMNEVMSGKVSSGWSTVRDLYNKYRIKIIRSLDASLSETLARQSPSSLLSMIEDPGVKQSLLIDEISIGDMSIEQLDANARTRAGPSGEIVRNYVFPYSDVTLPKDIRHLTYFIVTYCDIRGDDFGKSYKVSPNLVGNITIEAVVRDSAVVKSGILYVLKENRNVVWGGQIHHMADGAIHSGASHGPETKALVPKKVANTKIQDERALSKLGDFLLDFSINESKKYPTPKGSTKLLYNSPPVVVDRNASFTELYSNIDRDNVVRFFFGIDYDNLVAENTKFGKIYSNLSNVDLSASPVFASLFQKSEIIEMTLKRRRVNPTPEPNKLGSLVNNSTKFDEEENDEILLTVFPSSGGGINLDGTKASLKEIGIHTNAGAQGFRYFTGNDKSLVNSSYGSYQYALEIKIIDRSMEIINNMITRLERAKNILTNYIQEGSLPKNYNSRIGRFNPRFIASRSEKNSHWRRALNNYASVLSAVSLISNDASTNQFTTIDDTIQTLTPFVWSEAANSDSVRAVLHMVDSLATKLINLGTAQVGTGIGGSYSSPDVSNSDDRTSRAAPASLKLISIEHFFENQFDADFTRGVGYDYLTSNVRSPNTSGLFSISSANYLKRAESESLKFFKESNANVDITVKGVSYTSGDSIQNKDLQYLSPSSVRIFGNVHDLSSGLDIVSSKFDQVEEDTLYYNLRGQLDSAAPAPPKEDECSLSRTTGLVVESFDITEMTTDERDSAAAFFTDCGGSDDEPVLAPPVLDPPSPPGAFAKSAGPPATSQALSGLLRAMALGKTDKLKCISDCSTEIDLYNTLLPCNNIFARNPDSTEGDSRANQLMLLPNQIKSVILGNISNGVVNLDWFGTERATEDPVLGPIYRLGIEALREVEVLVGFKNSKNNKRLAQSPIFAPLSRAILSAAASNANFLCRLVPYTNEAFTLEGMPNNLELPIYNEYFIIRKAQVNNDVTTQRTSRVSPPSRSAAFGEQTTPELVQYAHTALYEPVPPPPKRRALKRRTGKVRKSNIRRAQTPAQASSSPPPNNNGRY